MQRYLGRMNVYTCFHLKSYFSFCGMEACHFLGAPFPNCYRIMGIIFTMLSISRKYGYPFPAFFIISGLCLNSHPICRIMALKFFKFTELWYQSFGQIGTSLSEDTPPLSRGFHGELFFVIIFGLLACLMFDFLC